MRRAPPAWAWAPYLGAFAEAGMVGACADWFAVVALFRHPLGLPIPHTAVVRGKQAAHRAGARALHHQQLSLSPRRHRPPLLGRRRRPRGAMARGRAQRAGDRGRRRTRHSLRARPRAESGDRRMGRLPRRDAGSRRSPSRRSPRGCCRSCGLKARARRCSTRASISSRRRSRATRRRSCDTCRRSRRAGSPNGSTT